MARHRFDPVSFVLGGVAVASGAIVLADRSITDDAGALLPGGLIALGVALFIRVVRSDDRPAPAGTTPTGDPVTPPVEPHRAGPAFAGGEPHPEDAPWPTDTDTSHGDAGPPGDDTASAEDDERTAP